MRATKERLKHLLHWIIITTLPLCAWLMAVCIGMGICVLLLIGAISIYPAYATWDIALGWKMTVAGLTLATIIGTLITLLHYSLDWLWDKIKDLDHRVIRPWLTP